MIARAARKARKAGLEVAFANAPAQALPFPDGRFDVAVSSMMLHHLPRSSREQCARELCRVLKPGGRVLVIDFDAPGRGSGFLGRLRLHRHGNLRPGELAALLAGAGLVVAETGAVGFGSLQFVLATAPQ